MVHAGEIYASSHESVLRDASLAFDCELLGDPLVDAFLKRQRKNPWQKKVLGGCPKVQSNQLIDTEYRTIRLI